MELKPSPGVILTVTLLLAGLGLAGVYFAVKTSPTTSEALPPLELVTAPSLSPSPAPVPTLVSSPAPTPSPAPVPTSVATPSPATASAGSGALRVSNRTDSPIRVVLLARQAPAKSYKKPAHWDFAPAEGSLKGLLLSLPEGKLKLQTGDIIVVFAQDGSRIYWGPYVVGETPMPVWNPAPGEWHLILNGG